MIENIDKIVGGAQKSGAFVIKNTSGEEIPQFSVCQISTMKIHATTGSRTFEVVKPTANSAGHVVFIEGHKIPSASEDQVIYPKATIDATYGGIPVTYSGTKPAVGDEVGAKSGSWTVEAGFTGFVVLGVDEAKKLVYVRPSGGGGGSARLVQATSYGANGLVPVKSIAMLPDEAATPNFVQTGNAFNLRYLRVSNGG